MTSEAVDVATALYEALSRRDGEAMAACYFDDGALFSDEVFVGLRGREIGAMWTMLCSRAHDMVVHYQITSQANDVVSVAWNATYTFTKTKRKVHNVIFATIQVKDGKIVQHIDRFDFWRWSRQALGPAGFLLGWTPFLKNKVRSEAAANLKAYIQKKSQA
jgi:limonene-1,2-epoxide hydrolase